MNCFKSSIYVLTLFVAIALTGCGGGGGGGSTTAAQSTTTLANNVTAKSFMAKNIASNYSSLNSNKQAYSMRAKFLSNIRSEIKTENISFGTAKLTYGPSDTISLLGVNYTYTGGSQILQIKDGYGNLVSDTSQVDTLIITNSNLAYNYYDGGALMSIVSNGVLSFSGFLSNTTFTVGAQNLQMAGLINNTDAFTWTLNANVSVDTTSYPYPKNGQQESGSIVFNNIQYNYVISYDGTNIANFSVSGAETFSMKINLATGVVVSSTLSVPPANTNTQLASEIVGTWKMVKYLDSTDGIMKPIHANTSGNVSTITFNSDQTGSSISYDIRLDNDNIYWITKEVLENERSGTWSVANSTLTSYSFYGTLSNTISITGNLLTQTSSDGHVTIWEKM